MTTSSMSSFEQAFHAEAIIGTSVRETETASDFLADKHGVYATNQASMHRGLRWANVKQRLHNAVSTRLINNTTLLCDSLMFPDVEILGNTISRWLALDSTDGMADLPRQTLEKVANFASIENPRALLQFIAKNPKIAAILIDAAKAAYQLEEHTSSEITVFGEPDDSDYSVYINTLLAVESYDKAYELEEAVFEKVIAPHFDLVDFKIMLAFDTDSDD